MKKITEAELKNRVNSLREYFTSLDEDPVNGKTPEEAMKDPRYTTDPAFKAEVDAAAAIGTPPAAVATPVAPPTPITGTDLPPTGSFDSFGNPVASGSASATSADPTGLAQAQQDVNTNSAAKVSAPAAPYIVRKGDNLTVIAKKMGITLQDLLKANPQFQAKGRNINLIYPNEKVYPPGTTAPASPVNPAPTKTAPFRKELSQADMDAIGNAGRTPAKESVSYADDQTLARIVSLGRR